MTPTPIVDASHYVRDAPTAELSKSVGQPYSFKFLYFPIHAAGSCSRELLGYGKDKFAFEILSPANWGEEKPKTPFHCMPVLYIKTKDGKDLVLSEASVIEHYLAKHMNLLGDNEYEELLIKSFHSSSTMFQGGFASNVTWCPPEVQPQTLAYFKANTFPTWIKTHTKHLLDNGDNGHYIGNKLSLADIRTANAIEHLSVQPCADELMDIIKKAPSLMKVRETVANDPKIAAWRASKEYQTLTSNSKAFFLNPMKFMGPPKI
ncbi:hypothetical protein EMPS_07214 [Entomortierella parvispora]|uniref:Glutathione S-transferase n=1 Tax=Entomortierella parvispora TaxID=205924 RepID=A0A9P3HDQ1_9FUNG|nr:hypothetical protein EMPS_07214 [Entomortierella parvispora]